MNTYFISESQLTDLFKNNKYISFYDFFVNVKELLKSMLKKPYDYDIPVYFQNHGIDVDDLIKKLKKVGILHQKETITEIPIDEEKQRSRHGITYFVRKRDFLDRLKKVYQLIK